MPYKFYLCLAHSIPSPVMLMKHMHQPITNDMIHFISSCDLIGSSILTSLALHRCPCPSAPSLCSSFTATWSVTPKPSTCPSHLQPVHQAKSCLYLLHLVTWLNVMSHMQWAPSSHIYLWTNLLCISYKHILVHQSCHSITKTKQRPFTYYVSIV